MSGGFMLDNAYKILLAEDDEHLGFMLQDNLEMAGYLVQRYVDGRQALEVFQSGQFHLCLFDVMLPGMDGFILAQEVRRRNSHVPIIFLTARGRKEDRIRGLKTGADDYLTKPFSMEELLLRVEAVLRRVYHEENHIEAAGIIHIGNTKLDTHNQQLQVKGQVVNLTRKESRLLAMLAAHQQSIVEREVIMKALWEDDGYFVARSMDVFISRLRKHLQADTSLAIVNIHGVGYRLEVNR